MGTAEKKKGGYQNQTNTKWFEVFAASLKYFYLKGIKAILTHSEVHKFQSLQRKVRSS